MIFNISHKRTGQKTEESILTEFSSTGNIELLGELYTNYLHLVYGVCLKYLKNREESKDAVMQIFEKLATEIPKHKIENFRSWLHIVTKNFCLMQLRSQKTRDERFKEWIIDESVFMETSSFLHPLDEDNYDLERELSDCIEQLKSEQKECIKKFYFNNKCYSEIAHEFKIDEKKVKSYLQNAKRNLKLCLEEKNDR